LSRSQKMSRFALSRLMQEVSLKKGQSHRAPAL
jgi:hypothetical protein